MKKVLFLAVFAVMAFGFSGCKDDNSNGRKLDPNSRIYINGLSAKGVQAPVAALVPVSAQAAPAVDQVFGANAPAANQTGANAPAANSVAEQTKLTPLEIVKQAQEILTSNWKGSIGDWNRDVANTRLVLGSDYIVNKQGELVPSMIEARNYVFVTWTPSGAPKDTIAYLPNATMDIAEKAIRAAFAAGDFDECDRLFMKAFTFIPTTGAEYRALKAAGNH